MTIRDDIEKGTALYNKGDVDGFCSYYGPETVLTTPDGRFEGLQNIRPYVQSLYDAFPSGGVSVGRYRENGDLYFGEFTVQGVNTGPLAMPDGSQLPATHRSVEVAAVEVARAENGRIVEHRMVWDNMAFLSQLGLVPES
ncbi:ester cyclase [Actinomycetospora endophytica]|uniref:Ester cyclase n=1 Tax=Actinomycetospora endophytica TaxID=2291215 RepID=A0ABS8P3L5_9PSEU|nr:ester cyclase [Actinomycetospora endophytica]MCD2192828.1 ester cyclase [Actinomycetospora endophytica]